MVKLILPDHLITDIEPHLPSDIDVVEVDSEGNLDGDVSDAEVYVNGFYLKTSTLDKDVDSSTQAALATVTECWRESHPHTKFFAKGHYPH